MDRFVTLLQRYQRDRKRNKRLTWKTWREREQRKNWSKNRVTGIVEETEDTIVEVVSCGHKKRKARKKPSEQQRKNEFWIEVVSSDRAKKQLPRVKVCAAGTSVKTWHLAKPFGRKRLELQTKVLCLIPTVMESRRQGRNGTAIADEEDKDGNDSLNEFLSSDDEPNDGNDDHEECFAGTVVEVSEGYVRIHFDGFPKSEDIWMLDDSPKMFLDGGRWEETSANMPPQHHYWQEMDSKKRLCD